MPFCGECGSQMPAGVVFCGECGNKYTAPAAAASPAAAAPAATKPAAEDKPVQAPTKNVDMNEELPHDTKTCAGCKQSLKGVLRLLTAMDQEWHPNCFVCSNCRGGFDGDDGKFFVRDGAPLCKNCSLAEAPKCAACNKPCTDNFLKAKALGDTSWHSECFVCGTCKKVIDGSFIVRDMKPFCSATCGDHHTNKAVKPAQAISKAPAAAAAPSAAPAGAAGGGAKKHCGECGSPLANGKTFCGECGHKN